MTGVHRLCAAALLLAAACGGDSPAGDDAGLDAGGDAAPSPDAGPPVRPTALDPSVLHDVVITIAPADLDSFDGDQVNRVPCDVVYDGVALPRSGCRKKGGIGSVDPVVGKPAFSIKFDELVSGQKLDDLDKLVLDNGNQDPTLLHQHLTYEVFRRAGLAAHFTAYAKVTFNGEHRGIYLAVEPVDREFLRARFGAGNDGGNLYEAPVVDFALDPDGMDLKDEVGRSRDDMTAAAAAVIDSADDALAAAVDARIDLDQFLRCYAVEMAMAAEDAYAIGRNNYYMYHRPTDDRFVFLPHGQDTVLDNPALPPDYPPQGRLAARIRAIPALSAAADAEIAALVAPGGAYDLTAMNALIDDAVTVVSSTDRADPFTTGDIAQMVVRAAAVKAQLAYRRGVLLGTAAAPDCGDGVLHRGEQCDDGDLDDGDGCDAGCRPECVNAMAGAADLRLCPAMGDWDAAIATCQAEGGALIVPADAAEARLLALTMRAHFANKDAWIAVTDTAAEGTWLTVAGAPPPYLGFVDPEPNGDTSENCVLLDAGYVGGWRDRSCGFDAGAICRLP